MNILKKAARLAKVESHRKFRKNRAKKNKLSGSVVNFQNNITPAKPVETISAPKEFALTGADCRDELIAFLKRVEYHLGNGCYVELNFDNTDSLMPCGTLWATAKLEKLVEGYPGKLSCTYPVNDVVEQLFQHIGLLSKLGIPNRRQEINADNVKHWQYVKGGSADDVKKFKELLHSISLKEEIRTGLFESMSEAVTNSIHHAYPGIELKEWRMFAQLRDGKLTVAICDQGVGIPNSLKNKPELKEWIKSRINRVKRKHDTFLIKLAIESSRSQTRLPHRGKGLKDMLEFVKNGTVGGFLVLSAKGAFSYNAVTTGHAKRDYKTSIDGTIIEWQILLGEEHGQ
jgi:hypothetical protein